MGGLHSIAGCAREKERDSGQDTTDNVTAGIENDNHTVVVQPEATGTGMMGEDTEKIEHFEVKDDLVCDNDEMGLQNEHNAANETHMSKLLQEEDEDQDDLSDIDCIDESIVQDSNEVNEDDSFEEKIVSTPIIVKKQKELETPTSVNNMLSELTETDSREVVGR